ncbi:MAG TPA: NADH-quinone oxidoreductase subunit F, partial [Clostridia bacterium]|nr:NADH-quinone oxidoreductase subunit F [Clostridia bacterium]
MATCGQAAGARPVFEEFKRAIAEKKLADVQVTLTGCIGVCRLEPIVEVISPGIGKVTYVKVKPDMVKKIIEEHLIGGKVVSEYTIGSYESKGKSTGQAAIDGMDYFKKQKRLALKNCGIINPENIDEYIGRDGYKALQKCLFTMSREEVIDTVKRSGLRGRGGAGFPTGLKWEFTYKANDDKKYVCCNADEGDPGAFMDRSILEGDPHALLEAMAIAGYAIGSDQGYIYVRAEYPVAVKRLEIAINQAKEYGLLGKNIMNTGFSFDIELRLGAGAFVCGEETALIASIEGCRGEPRPRPPFPAVKGVFGKPTLLNNVETYANITQIILNGAEWFASIGTEKSKGTKVFALGGKINNTGLVEIPMGIRLREIIEDIGGGIPNGKKFKAAQTGGPSGG